ncbi:GntR family transcriptional regulator [Kitasatospora sp. NPDC004614]
MLVDVRGPAISVVRSLSPLAGRDRREPEPTVDTTTTATVGLPGPRKGRTLPLPVALRAEIESGRWQPGKPLPGGSELAAAYSVSHTTISSAIRLLKDEQLLTGPAGGRTRFADRRRAQGGRRLRLFQAAHRGAARRHRSVRRLRNPSTAGPRRRPLDRAARLQGPESVNGVAAPGHCGGG